MSPKLRRTGVAAATAIAALAITALPAHAQPCGETPEERALCTFGELQMAAECAVGKVTDHSGPLKELAGEIVPGCFIHS